MSELSGPRKLNAAHLRSGFYSGARELDEWLRKYAMQNQKARNSTTYVITDGNRVVGYYAVAMAAAAATRMGTASKRSDESHLSQRQHRCGCDSHTLSRRKSEAILST